MIDLLCLLVIWHDLWVQNESALYKSFTYLLTGLTRQGQLRSFLGGSEATSRHVVDSEILR